MNSKVFEEYESEVRSYCRSFPTVFKTAKNAEMFDEEGNRYIDFFCGAGALNYGHNNNYVKERLLSYLQNDGIVHSLDMYTTAKRDFIDFFENKILIPRGLNYKIQFPGPTGTNAVEAALKLARKVKNRSNIFALMGAFHGMTLGSLALTTDKCSRGGAGVPLTNVTHLPAPYMLGGVDTIDYAQMLIDDDHSGVDKPAAFIIETVQAEGGIQIFSVDFLKRIRKFCDDNDILLIVDDVQVGCARTGTYFSFERAGIVPDIVAMSKSIGGFGMPFALTLFKPELDIWSPGEHNGTFRGNQLSIIAAKAGLECMLNDNIEAECVRKGKIATEFIENEILPLDSKLCYRAIGLAIGIDFSALGGDKISKAVMNKCFELGVIAERVGRDNAVLKLMPALTIEDDVLLEGLQIVRNAIKACL